MLSEKEGDLYLDQLLLDGQFGEFGDTLRAQFGHDAIFMRLNSLRADGQIEADFLYRFPIGQKLKDFSFPETQALKVRMVFQSSIQCRQIVGEDLWCHGAEIASARLHHI